MKAGSGTGQLTALWLELGAMMPLFAVGHEEGILDLGCRCPCASPQHGEWYSLGVCLERRNHILLVFDSRREADVLG